jgi:hypothetical protein
MRDSALPGPPQMAWSKPTDERNACVRVESDRGEKSTKFFRRELRGFLHSRPLWRGAGLQESPRGRYRPGSECELSDILARLDCSWKGHRCAHHQLSPSKSPHTNAIQISRPYRFAGPFLTSDANATPWRSCPSPCRAGSLRREMGQTPHSKQIASW